MAVVVLLLGGSEAHLLVGVQDDALGDGGEAVFGGDASHAERAAIGGAVVEVGGLGGVSADFGKGNHGHPEERVAGTVGVGPVFRLLAVLGVHGRLVAVQAELIVKDFTLGGFGGVDLAEDVFGPLGRPDAGAGLVAAEQQFDLVNVVHVDGVLVLHAGIAE